MLKYILYCIYLNKCPRILGNQNMEGFLNGVVDYSDDVSF